MLLLDAIIKIKKSLLRVYKEKGIIYAFRAYLGFLKEFALDERYSQISQLQREDMEMALFNEKIPYTGVGLETAWNCNRRYGKSRNLTIVATFLTLLDKKIIWRAPHTDQLSQAAEWFSMNPFVVKQKVRTQNKVGVVNSPTMNIGVLSEGKVASREANALIYDEGGWVFTDFKIYEYYKSSRPMIAASRDKWIIHASTPSRSTAFHETWEYLKNLEVKYSTQLTSLRTVDDCSWISKDFIAKERETHADCPWYMDQNYYGQWVVYGGAVFTDLILVGDKRFPKFPQGCLDHKTATHGGVDFNGANVGHYLVKITYDNKYIYILEEINFQNLWELDKQNISLELEEGLFNTQFTDQTKRMGLSCIYKQWKPAIKQERVAELQQRTIVIDKYRTPLTYKNLKEAGYDKNSRLPKLSKRTDQHGLDALLHAVHDVSGNIWIPSRCKPEKRPLFGGNKRYNPIQHIGGKQW